MLSLLVPIELFAELLAPIDPLAIWRPVIVLAWMFCPVITPLALASSNG